jgi:hypothetical protein
VTRANASFTIDNWADETFDETEILTAVAPENSMAYVGLERVSGRLTGQAEITRHPDGSHTFVLEYELP